MCIMRNSTKKKWRWAFHRGCTSAGCHRGYTGNSCVVAQTTCYIARSGTFTFSFSWRFAWLACCCCSTALAWTKLKATRQFMDGFDGWYQGFYTIITISWNSFEAPSKIGFVLCFWYDAHWGGRHEDLKSRAYTTDHTQWFVFRWLMGWWLIA